LKSPLLKEKNLKKIHKCLRFTDDEYQEILVELEKTNFSFSEYARNRILKRKKIECQVDKDMLIQIIRIGNNLNQIAKSQNSNNYLSILILEELQKIEKQLEEILS
jgi:predicted nuclease of predicted toxin-antitoxin system